MKGNDEPNKFINQDSINQSINQTLFVEVSRVTSLP